MTNRLYFMPILGILVLIFASDVRAEVFDNEGLAYQACMAERAIANTTNELPTAECQRVSNTTYRCTLKNLQGGNVIGCGNPGHTTFFEWTTATSCSAQPEGQNYFSTQEPEKQCVNGCEYEATTGSCATGQNGTSCLFETSPTGSVCDAPNSNDEDDLPVNCIRNEDTGQVSCDCSVDPTQTWCQIPEDPEADNCITNHELGITVCYTDSGTDSPSPPDRQDPDNPPDPKDSGGTTTTPNDPKEGEDDPSNRECNPASDADCEWTGSANASARCGTVPHCSGDPVQCALLLQSYNTMCAVMTANENKGKGTASSSGSCETQPPCTADAGICTLIVQVWKSECRMWKDDGKAFDPNEGVGEQEPGVFDGEEFTETIDVSEGGGIKTNDGWWGTASCPAPSPVETSAGLFAIDYSVFCDAAHWLSFFVMFMASMTSARILFG